MAQDSSRQRTRSSRSGHQVATRTIVALAVVALVVGIAAVAVGANALRAARSQQTEPPVLGLESLPASSATTLAAEAAVEVPALAGMDLPEAEMVLSAAGFAIQVTTAATSSPGGTDRVVDQDPAAGVLADAGSTVRLVLESVPDTAAVTPKPTPKTASPTPKKSTGFVVCIDPGHQGRSDSSPEPVGPGSKTTKARVTGGATGVGTKVPEYEVVLQISMNLKKRLESRGIKVVMTRTTNDVNLSNAERATIANKAKADLFVRVHGDGSPDSSISGLSTLYPGKNKWTTSITAPSKRAARFVHSAAVSQTGAVDRGIKARTDLSGFNWSKVPAVLIECGFLSNRVEDKLLVSPHYQDKLAEGMAKGVLRYLEAEAKR